MKTSFACFLCLSILISAVNGQPAIRQKIAAEIQHSLEAELLQPWYPKDVDSVYGGFLSAFTYDFRPEGNQDKMIVTQARHIWSNARAAEFFPEKTYYKKSAEQGYHFLRDFFWDKKYGGFYTLLSRDGKTVKNSGMGDKIAYGNAFGIYGLAAYYRCSGDTGALNLAIKAFNWLEKHSHDPIHKGYFQHMQLDGTPVQRTAAMPATAETGYKDQNSSIHLLEAFTELYQVWPNEVVGERLKEMLLLVRDVIVTPRGNLQLFFTANWKPVSIRDSSKETILKHHNLDYVSFGHDVETAYLLQEASAVLGWKNDTPTKTIAKKMIDHALQNGWDNKAGGFYDEGFYFRDSAHITILRNSKNWWAQAEGLNTLLLMSDDYPNDRNQYFKKFLQQWNYVQTYLIDHKYGDWYSGGLDKEPEQKLRGKGNIWKGTYHVLRALINCEERLRPDTIPPATPSHLAEHNGQLTWNGSSDNRLLSGYLLYRAGIRVAFTPLVHFNTNTLPVKKGAEWAVQAVDLAGNRSPKSNKIMY